MTEVEKLKTTELCPTCGATIKEGDKRCAVCGTILSSPTKTATSLRGTKMPQITLSLPVAIGLLALFLAIGAIIVYFALQQTGRVVEPTPSPTATFTITPSITPTPITPTPTATPLPSPTPFTYTVSSGDSCLAIAARFEVSVQSIIRLNNLNAACTLFEGQELLIPYPTPTASPFPTATLSGIEATRAACESVTYTVEEGDTLSSIATNYAVPMSAIQEYNGLVNNVVFSGMNLVIPLCERAATPGPSPTPVPPPPYPAPNLLLPPDGSVFSEQENSVTIQWSAVGTLNENEAYQVIIEDITQDEGRKIVDYVNDTKYVIPESFRANDNLPHIYRWQVTTARNTGTDENGNPIWVSAGAISTSRVFTWIGKAIVSTPTP